ncbi:nuclear nucleic acid-binding protein C1D [Lampris incognitus]|uniref:nuclear nucleic acid-binding protein C1D n=1 Tax=Lampris incognitus TaxID=2546036 RepID=UPI0024B62F97|nr:nuclear nucleic acid-binding protein C1D [Lampris incognitus]
MAEKVQTEDYPTEIDEHLMEFNSSVNSVDSALQTLMSMPKNDLQKLDPLEQAKLDLMSAYALNSLFWMYLVTKGVNPKDHGIKQELERTRTYMNRVKEITDRKKAARVDKVAAARFVRNALYDAEEGASKKEGASNNERASKEAIKAWSQTQPSKNKLNKREEL